MGFTEGSKNVPKLAVCLEWGKKNLLPNSDIRHQGGWFSAAVNHPLRV